MSAFAKAYSDRRSSMSPDRRAAIKAKNVAVLDQMSANGDSKGGPPAENRELHLKEVAARLYGSGQSRDQVARTMRLHLCELSGRTGLHADQQVYVAKRVLRKWERDLTFRDMVYTAAIGEVDMATPAILRGVAQKAKRGRVDAARFLMEVTGRHNPKGDQAPTAIQIVMEGVPRPKRIEAQGEVLELEAGDE